MSSKSGWCSPAPGCTHTQREHVSCRSEVCEREAFGGHESVSTEEQTVLAMSGATWDNGGTNQDGPGDSLRQQRAVFPGPRRTVREFD